MDDVDELKNIIKLLKNEIMMQHQLLKEKDKKIEQLETELNKYKNNNNNIIKNSNNNNSKNIKIDNNNNPINNEHKENLNILNLNENTKKTEIKKEPNKNSNNKNVNEQLDLLLAKQLEMGNSDSLINTMIYEQQNKLYNKNLQEIEKNKKNSFFNKFIDEIKYINPYFHSKKIEEKNNNKKFKLPKNVNLENLTYENILNLEEKIGYVSKGINKKDMEKLGEEKYKYDINQKECIICMEIFKENEKIRKLKCSHIFHLKCIDGWLENNKSCPICKKDVNI